MKDLAPSNGPALMCVINYPANSGFAWRYLEELDQRLLLPLPPRQLERQALLGFPVLVNHREHFHALLYKNGIRGITLCDRWWFDRATRPGTLYWRHYLLPISHYMSDADVSRAAQAANSAFRGATDILHTKR